MSKKKETITPDSKYEAIRERAKEDLEFFIKLVFPKRCIGSIHQELIHFLTRQDKKSHQLVLLPREHQKSAFAAFYVAWKIVRDPAIRVLYISSTTNLAEKQLKMVKDILTSKQFMMYFPEYVNPDESKREKWTNSEISIDHESRKEKMVRDPTIFTGGLTTSLTGLHCDLAVLDDVVVMENASTSEGREKAKSQYSLLSSIEGADSEELVVGTRYHNKDLYNDLLQMKRDIYSEDGTVIDTQDIYEVFERQVENIGDGTGEFLWTRQQGPDGKWYGFNREILAKKRGQYLDKTQFYAQYYNRPDMGGTNAISSEKFQYYNKGNLEQYGLSWFLGSNKLNIVASIDFAYSLSKRSDYTALVIAGKDVEGNIIVLDIDRFQTDRIVEYYQHISAAYSKWGFKKLKAETTGAQKAIVKQLKDYLFRAGIMISVEEFAPTYRMGTKAERINNVLQPLYDGYKVWHYQGGNCQVLEDELTSSTPAHDDVKDALATAVDGLQAPANNKLPIFMGGSSSSVKQTSRGPKRFGFSG